MTARLLVVPLLFLALCLPARADVGDPQVRTDHPWYPGELACSTFERLFATQADLYQRAIGVRPTTDEQKALAAWLWRNTHYAHGEEGVEDLWGKGFAKGGDTRTRDYWTGLFAHGFGLCGTTHSQWVAEMEALLGHNRGRGVGTAGHNAFEVFLTGGPYGDGKWVLLDHDLSTVIYNKEGTALLSLAEIHRDWKKLTDRQFMPQKQHGWLVCGLHPSDGGSYADYKVAEYLAGYSGAPPMIHLRRGETLRRYLQPGLEDGKTFVFWGRNYKTGNIPGPERSHTWVNQPEKMHGSTRGAVYSPGQARYGNAVYVYKPDFSTEDYREGLAASGGRQPPVDGKEVVFEFSTPFIIAATPANDKPWGIYDPGCRNGLVVRGQADCAVSVSTDHGKTWHDCGKLADALDLTDHVKGTRQYQLRLHTGADNLKKSGLSIATVCQANPALFPRLKDNGATVQFQASGQAVASTGPTLAQVQSHVVEGKLGSPKVTLELASPHGEKVMKVYAVGQAQSGSPPRAETRYQIEASTDGGKSWAPVVKDWKITRRGDEPKDFWSQSFCWGALDLGEQNASTVRVRFRNDGGRNYLRCEAQLVYQARGKDSTRVTFAWTDDAGPHQVSHTFGPAKPGDKEPASWQVPTGANVQTRWVEFEPVGGR